MKNIISVLYKKFFNALNGFYNAAKEESSLKIQFFVSIVVIILGIIFKISLENWIIVILLISLIISLELINSSIENLLDLFSYKYDINVKKIKDIFAAAILLISIAAIIIGLLIFIPKFIN